MKFSGYLLEDFKKNNYGFVILSLQDFIDKVSESSVPVRYNFFVFILCQQGYAKQTIDDVTFDFANNHAYFINYGQFHKTEKHKCKGSVILFTTDFYNLIYTGNKKVVSDKILLRPPTILRADIGLFSEMRDLTNMLKREFEKVAFNREVMCMLLKVLVMLYTQNHSNYNRGKSRKRDIAEEYKILVNEYYKELKSPIEYAKQLFITPNYLNVLCKQVFGQTASNIIEERTLLEAKRLLVHTNYSVSQISLELGFSDNSHFGKYFKRGVKMSPEYYRDSLKDIENDRKRI